MTNFHNTLFVTNPKAFVAKEGESLKVKVEGETRLQIPMHHLISVVCFGPALVSPEAMASCGRAGIAVVFFSPVGAYQGRFEGALSKTATLRRAQYHASEDEGRCLQMARGFVAGKLANSRVLLRRAGRTRAEKAEELGRAAARLGAIEDTLLKATSLDELRGIEGDAAARYFEVFDAMLEAPGGLCFEKRTRRPPENEVNALLSFGYALLSADCSAAVQGAGLDPAVGFLHGERPGRPALALDLMEEFRAMMVDRMVLAMLRLGQIKGDEFERLPTGEVRMSEGARKKFLLEYQRRKQEEVTHPLTGQAVTWGLLPHLQARLLARAVRQEGEYVPYLAR